MYVLRPSYRLRINILGSREDMGAQFKSTPNHQKLSSVHYIQVNFLQEKQNLQPLCTEGMLGMEAKRPESSSDHET